jgi:excisionase family DNA binding protein
MSGRSEPTTDSASPLTTGIAARVLECSETHVRDLARRGILPAVKTSNGIRLFNRVDVERLAAERAERLERRSSA